MKTLVYDTVADNAEELVAQIAKAAGEIRDMPATFQDIWNSMYRGCETFEVAGQNSQRYL